MPLHPQLPNSGIVSGYVDEAGHPRIRMSIAGFLDILGFSQSIRDSTQLADAQLLVDGIAAAIEDSRRYVRENLAKDFASLPASWAMKFFTDNLVLGYPSDGIEVSAEMAARFIILCAQRYQLRMVLNGFFIRGALTQGPICLTDDIIFGAALLECYQLESKTSIVPRVLLTEPLRKLFVNSLNSDPSQHSNLAANSICRDIDGWWFISYLEAASDGAVVDWDIVERHKRSVLASMEGIKGHDVLPKYGWVCRYHNMFCHWHHDAPGYSDDYRINRVDERSTICRLSDATD